MFIQAYKVKWWRVVSFAVLLIIVAVGLYYLAELKNNQLQNIQPNDREVQAWQV